jgi:hypothetical protein
MHTVHPRYLKTICLWSSEKCQSFDNRIMFRDYSSYNNGKIATDLHKILSNAKMQIRWDYFLHFVVSKYYYLKKPLKKINKLNAEFNIVVLIWISPWKTAKFKIIICTWVGIDIFPYEKKRKFSHWKDQ